MTLPRNAQALRGSDRRRWPRYALGPSATFTLTADGQTQGCTMEDVSLGGAMLRLDGDTPRNLEMRIEHPTAGRVHANRCWVRDGVMGVEFDPSPRTLELVAYCLESLAEPKTLPSATPDRPPATPPLPGIY
ncbi:MAG: PilZ domain-containing protein [Kiloniellales bacterium]